MGATGTTTLDFGTFPGSNVAQTDVVTAGVVSTSLVEAWIRPAASADHTIEDHLAAPMRVVGAYLSDGNIRVTGMNTNDVIPPLEFIPDERSIRTLSKSRLARQNTPMFVGVFNVNWVWN